MIKKLTVLALIATMTFGCALLTACGGSGTSNSEPKSGDTSKTIVNVSLYNAGLGKAYMEDAEKEFESLFADRVFEEGKKGVDIVVDDNKKIGSDILSAISFGNVDLYFSEQIYYNEFVSQGLVASLDEVLTNNGQDFGESKTLSDKMSPSLKNAYTHTDGSVYALPTYYASVGIQYNKALFEEYNLYFTNADGKKTDGPDGKPNSYDDGLPATYSEFYELCDKMLDYQITPITWADLTYVNALLTELQCDYEGVDDMMLNFTFNGKAKNLVKAINDDGSLVLEEKDITEDNGYDVYRQAGRYYALSFIETLIKNGYVNTAALSSSSAYSYTAAQQDFIMSGIGNKKKVGMLVDGCWWENESSGIFAELVDQLGSQYSKENMSFGYMPLPKATAEKVGSTTTAVSELGAGVIMNAKTTGGKAEAAKLFLRYMFTDKQMNNFVKTTGVPYVYDYDINSSACTKYGVSLNDYVKNSNVVFPFSNSTVYNKNASKLNIWFKHWDTLVSGSSYTNINPIIDGNVNAKGYFNGLYDYRKNDWSSMTK